MGGVRRRNIQLQGAGRKTGSRDKIAFGVQPGLSSRSRSAEHAEESWLANVYLGQTWVCEELHLCSFFGCEKSQVGCISLENGAGVLIGFKSANITRGHVPWGPLHGWGNRKVFFWGVRHSQEMHTCR